jgi:hypothetical protein
MKRDGVRSSVILAAMIAVAVLQGCTIREASDAFGTYRATQTDSGQSVPVSGSFTVADELLGNRLTQRLQIGAVSFGLPAAHDVGEVAALDARLARPLEEPGPRPITGGAARVWTYVPGSTSTVRAAAMPGWTLSGELDVTEVVDYHPDEPDVGERVLVKTIRGTFDLTAAHADGDTISLRDGTFELEIEHYRYEWEP